MNERRMRKYHTSVFVPEDLPNMLLEFLTEVRQCFPTGRLGYTNHAKDEQIDTRSQIPPITIDDLFNPQNTIVEFYELLDENDNSLGKLQKVVVRMHHLNNKFDYTYVIARDGYVITNWPNRKYDIHTLKVSRGRYYSPANQVTPIMA